MLKPPNIDWSAPAGPPRRGVSEPPGGGVFLPVRLQLPDGGDEFGHHLEQVGLPVHGPAFVEQA